MRSIEKRFKKTMGKYPPWSSYICFAEAIKKQKFTKPMINQWFSKLVEKDDYSKGDKKQVLRELENLSNLAEDTQF